MRIVCDNCGAKYQISDDKVRNKVFKIRCKRCAHVIVVRAKQEAEPSAAEPAPQPAEEATKVVKFDGSREAAPPEDAIWYVVISREQVGPLTKAQVEQHFHQGDIDGEAFAWSEGMADWTRLGSVAEFAPLFPAAVAAEEAEPTVGEIPAPGTFAGLDEPDDDVIASNNVAADAPAGGYESPRVSGDADHLRSQRNENSVLFSLDSLAAEESSRAVSNTGGSDGSGLIDISALARGGAPSGAAAPMGDDPFGGGGGFAPVSAAPIGAGPMPSLVAKPGPSTGKMVLIVTAVVLVLGGGGFAAWYLTRREAPKPNPVVASNGTSAPATVKMGTNPRAGASTAAPSSAAPSAAPSAAVPSAPSSALASAPPSAAATEAAPALAANTKPAARKKTPKRTAKRRSSRKKSSTPLVRRANPEDAPPVAARKAPTPKRARRAPAKKAGKDELDDLLGGLDAKGSKGTARTRSQPAAKAAPAGDPMLPEKLSRAQILSVVRRNAGSIRSCSQSDPNARGTVTVKMSIGQSGRVSSAAAQPPFRGTPVGNCVEGKVKMFRFPQFSGGNMRINMPFAI